MTASSLSSGSSPQKSPIALLGLPLHPQTLDEIVSEVLIHLQKNKADTSPRWISTINLDFLCQAHGWRADKPQNPELLKFLRKSWRGTADGMPLVWLAKFLGQKNQQRVTGIDLLHAFFKEFQLHGHSVYLLGGTKQELEGTVKYLKERYPFLKIAGSASPQISLKEKGITLQTRAIIDGINQAKPDLLILALGCPKQELWFQRTEKLLNVPFAIGTGGAFKFLSGVKKRAPVWMQKGGLEWLFRLKEEPLQLFGRYAHNIVKGAYLFTPLIFNRLKSFFYKTPLQKKNFQVEGSVIKLPTVLEGNFPPGLLEKIAKSRAGTLKIDFKNLRSANLQGLGGLLTLYSAMPNKCLPVHISKRAEKVLKINRLWDLFICKNQTTILKALVGLFFMTECLLPADISACCKKINLYDRVFPQGKTNKISKRGCVYKKN